MYQSPTAPPAPVVEHQPIELIPSRLIRQGDHPELPVPIPGLLEGYLTVLAGAGGAGKTFLAEQIVRHLSSGVQLGQFPLPDAAMTSWFLVLEDVEALTQARSLDVAGFGTIAEDGSVDDIGFDTVKYITDGKRGIPALRDRLTAARAAGEMMPGCIIIDYLHLFIGGQPSGVNPVEWERLRLTELRELGIEYGAHIVVLTHMTKEGKVNGTSALLNVPDTMYVLELKDDRAYAVLTCKKMRLSPQVDYAVVRKMNGSWGFDDQVFVSEARAEGIIRDILATLRRGPRTLSMLVNGGDVSGERGGIRSALSRARARGYITSSRGHWVITPGPGDASLMPAPPRMCAACKLIMTLPGTELYHPTCEPDPELPPPAATPMDTAADAVAAEQAAVWGKAKESERTKKPNALNSLMASVRASKYHPVPVVRMEERTQAPWTHITDQTGGQANWYAPGYSHNRIAYVDDAGRNRYRTQLVIPDSAGTAGAWLTLDRNGSYPSACSSVPVAPNILRRTGTDLDPNPKAHAGIYRVEMEPWDLEKFPHPLGSAAAPDGGPTWISAPHYRMLCKLGLPFELTDSWTGVPNESLFERFYKDARQLRSETGGGAHPDYLEWKKSMGPALRMLWSGVSSPFWRPDWRVSVVAEASVRHWLKAWTALGGGDARLVALVNTDEATWWSPSGVLPYGYVEGSRFGDVEVKRIDRGSQQ